MSILQTAVDLETCVKDILPKIFVITCSHDVYKPYKLKALQRQLKVNDR